MGHHSPSELYLNDSFLARTPVTSFLKITPRRRRHLVVSHFLLAPPGPLSFLLLPFLPGEGDNLSGLNHQIPLPCGFQLNLADRAPWQKMRGKEDVEVLIPPIFLLWGCLGLV